MIGAIGPPGARKARLPVRFAVAQDQDAAGDQSEREQRADIRKVGERADIEQSRGNADDEARHPGGKIGRAEARMHAAENAGQQSVARHGKPDARLPELKNEQRRDHAHQRADQNDQAHAAEVKLLQRVHHRRGIVDERLPGNQPGQHDDHADVQQRADDQRGNDADGQIALRVFAFFGGGGDGIESDVGEEDDRAAGQNAGPAVGREGMPVGGMNEARGER